MFTYNPVSFVFNLGNRVFQWFTTNPTEPNPIEASPPKTKIWYPQNPLPNGIVSKDSAQDIDICETIINYYFRILLKEFAKYHTLENGIINIIKIYLKYSSETFILNHLYSISIYQLFPNHDRYQRSFQSNSMYVKL